VDDLLDERLDYLRKESLRTLDGRGKCYPYGCFQALLLSRFYPGWQKDFFKEKKLLDQAIAEKLNISPEEKKTIVQELKERYPYEEIVKRNTKRINERDAAIEMIQNRKGRVYVINFKPVREYFVPEWRGEAYSVGLMEIAPKGIKKIELRDIIFEGEESPIMKDQLYYLKWIDTVTPPGEKGYTMEYSRKEGEDIFYDAVFRTKGFVLKAPKVQLKDRRTRVKVSILAKIRNGVAPR
jgi:hypothetical protein